MAAPPALVVLVGAAPPLLGDAAAEGALVTELEEEAASWVGFEAVALLPLVKAASFSMPAVTVTGMKNSSVEKSVMVTVVVPGSLASGPAAMSVQTAVP